MSACAARPLKIFSERRGKTRPHPCLGGSPPPFGCCSDGPSNDGRLARARSRRWPVGASARRSALSEDEPILELTADIVAAHVANNSVGVGEVLTLIRNVHGALRSLETAAQVEDKSRIPAVSVRASVKPDSITCLACGSKQKTLKRHLQSAHGLTREQYRERYGLPAGYPMTAPNYSERRSALAKSAGLGRKKGQSAARLKSGTS